MNMFSKLQERLQLITDKKAPFVKAMADLFAQHEFLDKAVGIDAKTLDRQPSITPETLYVCIRERSPGNVFQGAQEDAQEFLTFLLDQLHEELLSLKNILKWRFTQASDADSNRDSNTSGEWLEMGKNQKVSLARTMEYDASPISFLFFGIYRSVVKRPRAKDSVTSEPFHCISLDIDDPSVESLEGALEFMTRTELIENRTSKRLVIESAPPILIIQFKRFVFDPISGVCKLSKSISYPETLELPEGVLYRENALHRNTPYKLFSVIYHHGWSANGGHYTCHVRQTLNEEDPWILFNDSSFTFEALDRVLMTPQSEKTGHQTCYVLVYVRIKKRIKAKAKSAPSPSHDNNT